MATEIIFPVNPEIDQVYTSTNRNSWIWTGYAWDPIYFEGNSRNAGVQVLNNGRQVIFYGSPAPLSGRGDDHIGFNYWIEGDDLTKDFLAVGTWISITNTPGGVNDGLHQITANYWDPINFNPPMNMFTWDSIVLEGGSPFGDYQYADIFYETNFDLELSNRHNIVKFVEDATDNYDISATDKSLSKIGDTLCFTGQTTSNIRFAFSSNDFFIWSCGDVDNNWWIDERAAINFIFDGEKWVATYDNC